MKDNKKDIEYQIVKSESGMHTIQYKMIKKEYGLEKARVDEGKSDDQKREARKERHRRIPKKSGRGMEGVREGILYDDPINAAKRTASAKYEQKKAKQKQQQSAKFPSKKDLEYPMAASEKECNCKDCDCDKKEMNKREKFYIQKIQELRKAGYPARYKENPEDVARAQQLIEQRRNSAINRLSQDTPPSSPIDRFSVSAGNNNKPISGREMVDRMAKIPQNKDPNQPLVYPNPSKTGAPTYLADKTLTDAYNQKFRSGSKSDLGEYVMRDAPQGTERATQGMLNDMTGFMPKQAAPAAAQKATPAGTTPAVTQTEAASKNTQAGETPSQPEKTPYDIKNPYKIESAKNFGDAFNQARSKIGAGGVFEYGGKKYHTYTQDEFKNPEKNNIDVNNNQFYKDWQARKDTTGPNAYYANKMNPAPAAKQTMAPAESIKDTPATPNIENASSANPMKGPDLGSIKLRPDQNMMPKNQA